MSINHVRPWRNIYRRKSRQIHVGSVPVGGDAPISVQTMTNTDTTDVAATVAQIQAAAEAGADIVRVSTPDEDSTRALREIVRESPVPIVADIHFHYRRAIEAAEAGAACLRINPGNIGKPERVREVVRAAKDHGCAIRIGVNAGSLERELLERYGEPCPEAMVESALDHIRILEDHDFFETKISCKASDVFLAVAAYQQLAEACDYPLHIGITEAGGMLAGMLAVMLAIGAAVGGGGPGPLAAGDPVETLFQALVTNEVLTSVLFEFIHTTAEGQEEVYQTIRLVNATVSRINYMTGTGGDSAAGKRSTCCVIHPGLGCNVLHWEGARGSSRDGDRLPE